VSGAWSVAFRLLYRLLRLIDPLVRAWYRTGGAGNIVELRVMSRRSGRPRSVLVGLLRAGDALYVGHPDGHAEWTLDLEAAGEGQLVWADGLPLDFRPVPAGPGAEREAVIRATNQHPFPANVVYRLARRHVRAAGVYYRVEPPDAGGGEAAALSRPSESCRHRST
jgi:hypothetical protein